MEHKIIFLSFLFNSKTFLIWNFKEKSADVLIFQIPTTICDSLILFLFTQVENLSGKTCKETISVCVCMCSLSVAGIVYVFVHSNRGIHSGGSSVSLNYLTILTAVLFPEHPSLQPTVTVSANSMMTLWSQQSHVSALRGWACSWKDWSDTKEELRNVESWKHKMKL